MKKAFLIGLFFALVFQISPSAMAGRRVTTCSPQHLNITTDSNSVLFDWIWECPITPIKYVIYIEILLNEKPWNDPLADIQLLSFSTCNRIDGADMNDTFLDVPIHAFLYWNGENYCSPCMLNLPVRARVIAQGVGGSYQNTFSDWGYFTMPTCPSPW
jgi:hypothetical protein